MFFSSFRQFKPIAVPRPVVLQQVQTLRVHTNDWAVACSVQHTLGVIYTSGEIAIAMQPTTSTAACSEAGLLLLQLRSWPGTQRPSRLGSQLDPPATFSLPDSVSKRAVVDERWSLREESVKRYVHDLSEEFANHKINVLHLPQHFSQLEARKPTTTTLNSKNERYRRQQQLFAASRMRTSFAPRVQTGRGKASSPLDPEEPSLSSIKQAPFFHCTIARLAAAHTFLMAEISRHALNRPELALHGCFRVIILLLSF